MPDAADFAHGLTVDRDGNTIVTGRSVAHNAMTISTVKYLPNIISSVYTNEVKPRRYALFQNYPNPFNPTTAIGYSLLVNGSVSLKVYNILGEEVATLVYNEVMEAGTHSVAWDASGFASGVYFYRLNVNSGGFVDVKKLLLLK